MNRAHHRLTGLALGLLLLSAASGARPSTGFGGEFHFVIHDLEGEAAAWSPREVVIHRRTDLDGGLFFVLENPTPRTHVFEAPGLFEQIVEGPEAPTVKPLRVYVTPGETVRVQVSIEQLHREPEPDASGAQTCPFFCPLHGADEDLRSTIRVVP
ncbi:MAG: hypothetical protein IT391_16320 [Nitrospira sp.]|nr:hypothetical protein [Nitrospira sp.]